LPAFEEIRPGTRLRGLDPAGIAEVVSVSRFGTDALNLVFRVDGRVAERRGNDGISRHRIHRRSRHPAEFVEMVRIGCERGDHRPIVQQIKSVVEAEKAIDRAVAPKKVRLVPLPRRWD
jgi:hypothetical protein